MRNWVACLTKYTMPRAKDKDIDEMIRWAEAAVSNPADKKDLAKWVNDAVNMWNIEKENIWKQPT